MTKAIVLISGGLDSRLALKIMQEQGIKILALNFKFPFGSSCCDTNCSFNFCQVQGIKLKVIDCTKGKLFQEYLNLVKKPKHGTGTAINPCIDCRIFILKKAKEIMKKECYDFIVTGEVLGERPMSQYRKALDLVEKESGLKGKILRPLSAKRLEETEPEKKRIS
ncbi:MAG: 7-cyano-7-deazaguanine synthase [archaeon]|nr:MAG: 7-cyano-7-deazaguanine synthase [archaeon]